MLAVMGNNTAFAYYNKFDLHLLPILWYVKNQPALSKLVWIILPNKDISSVGIIPRIKNFAAIDAKTESIPTHDYV